METPEQLRPVRRVLVVCSPSLAVAMAWNGEQFFVKTCCALRLQPHPQENADSGMFRGGKRRLWGDVSVFPPGLCLQYTGQSWQIFVDFLNNLQIARCPSKKEARRRAERPTEGFSVLILQRISCRSSRSGRSPLPACPRWVPDQCPDGGSSQTGQP